MQCSNAQLLTYRIVTFSPQRVSYSTWPVEQPLIPWELPQFSQPDRERRSATGLTLNRDIAAHHLTEAPADGEAKARAAIFARGRCIGLGEFLEELTHLCGSHADGSVSHRERDPVAVVLRERHLSAAAE
jgi:hypothetical protein